MKSIFLTGCNRGVGFGLVKTLLKLPTKPEHIFATCRNPSNSQELIDLAKTNANLHIVELDILDYESFENVVKQVNDIVGNNGLNVLFNNAGFAPKSTRLQFVKSDDLVKTLLTNSVAPVLLTKAFIPLLKKASEANQSEVMGVNRAAIINMSSILGSIGSNVEGGIYAYRMSKSAKNAATKSMSIDFKSDKILCVAMHPGWVKTDMGGSNAPLTVEESCSTLIKTLMTLNESHNGGFYEYDGRQLPW